MGDDDGGADEGRRGRIAQLEAELAALRSQGTAPIGTTAHLGSLVGDLRVLELLPDYVAVVDRARRVAFVNRVGAGYVREHVVGASVFDFVAPALTGRFGDALDAVFADAGALDVEFQSRSLATFRSHLVPLRDGAEVAYVLTVSRDVSETRAAELALRDSEARLRHAIEASGMGTWTWTIGEDRVSWDSTLHAIFGTTPDDGPIDYRRYLSFVVESDLPLVAATIAHALETGTYREIEHGIVRADGSSGRVVCKGVVTRDASGAIVGLRGGVFDVSERHRLRCSRRRRWRRSAGSPPGSPTTSTTCSASSSRAWSSRGATRLRRSRRGSTTSSTRRSARPRWCASS